MDTTTADSPYDNTEELSSLRKLVSLNWKRFRPKKSSPRLGKVTLTAPDQKPRNSSSTQHRSNESLFEPQLHWRKLKSQFFKAALISAVLLAIGLLIVLLSEIAITGLPWLRWSFITNFASRFVERAGIQAAIMGSLWVIFTTAGISIPIGVGAAIYLEEYATKNKLSSFIEINLSNLAAVPSILYGLLGLVIFVRQFALGQSVLAGAITMSLLILPVIIVASREGLRNVPLSIRQASYALGATKWQTIRSHVLPSALPGILTGVILSVSRAIGETAPLIMVGSVTYIAFNPEDLMSAFTVLPIQIFDWASRPQARFHDLAAAGILVLLAVLLSLNTIAVLVRNHFQRKQQWQ